MKNGRRILAWIGIALILLMYVLTIIFAIMDNPNAKNWLMAAIFCTVAVPVIIYAIQLAVKHIPGVKFEPEENDEDPADEEGES
ncbi:MAG: hypothetical protein IKI84_05355 [Clostridia bacterium]|nr:hypothetical protein [Lachnospiraceae bacterium]MBR6706090.1 hypothetical protein [Clostridia bacterium]